MLQVAGPVAWDRKQGLLEELAAVDPRLRHAVFRALAGSASDVLGDLGPGAARLLDRLVLPDDTPDLAALRARLALP